MKRRKVYCRDYRSHSIIPTRTVRCAKFPLNFELISTFEDLHTHTYLSKRNNSLCILRGILSAATHGESGHTDRSIYIYNIYIYIYNIYIYIYIYTWWLEDTPNTTPVGGRLVVLLNDGEKRLIN